MGLSRLGIGNNAVMLEEIRPAFLSLASFGIESGLPPRPARQCEWLLPRAVVPNRGQFVTLTCFGL